MLINNSTENKTAWCEAGAEKELEFVEIYGDTFNVQMNPEKDTNKYTLDLIDQDGLADLKTQTEPFYRAHTYGLNPLTCVSLNRKDMERYWKKSPDIRIYFWINFDGGTRFGVSIPKLECVKIATVREIAEMIQRGLVPLHHYQKRGADKINASCSYLVDTSLLKQVFP